MTADKNKSVVLGMLAHVDAGKTTLTESLLYESGVIKTLGRVDRGTAFLDTNPLEKSRGITIYTKEARFTYGNREFTLLDTPGHMDFSPEMERSLSVLDYGVLVISAMDGVQSHTVTLWHLLKKHGIPTFVFVNKMDLPEREKETLLSHLKSELSETCVDFTQDEDTMKEELSLCGSETLLETYLETGEISLSAIQHLIKERNIVPCYFGSALKLQDLSPFLKGLETFTLPFTSISKEFSGKVFKITRDEQGNRLTHLKVTGGNLGNRDILSHGEKVTEIRLYSGEKYTPVKSVGVGRLCAVAGLQQTSAGDCFGKEKKPISPILAPVLSYSLELPADCDVTQVVKQLKQLQEEDPALDISWVPSKQRIQVQIMGDVQIEILSQVILDRFGYEVIFSEPDIIYRETLSEDSSVIGVGHFEPLRHYAEVVLEIESLPSDTGIIFSVDEKRAKQLSLAHQHLVLSHLLEKIHGGVLCNAPLTDLRITLIGGKAHLKHTEGGDFREAVFRALRQGLMQGTSILLEPWVRLELHLPTVNLGRAMSDLQRMGGEMAPPLTEGEDSILKGSVPLSQLGNYPVTLRSYTQGRGRMSQSLLGYRPCVNAAAVIKRTDYNPLKDPENPAESIFCKQGSGYPVSWDQVHDHCHCELPKEEVIEIEEPTVLRQRVRHYESRLAEDKELMEIFQRTYGKIDVEKLEATLHRSSEPVEKVYIKPWSKQEEFLLVDGYNIIFAWEELDKMAQEHLDSARTHLLNQLCNFQAFKHCQVIVVFDAYKVKGGTGTVEPYYNITQVFTKEAETADMFIEKVTHKLSENNKVRVATSDAVEQRIILGHGALRLSARGLKEEMEQMNQAMRKFLQ